MKYEYSAGGYVVHKNKLLLIKAYHNRKTEISIPKGHIRKTENKLEAAKREVFEETGYKYLKLIKKLKPDIYYFDPIYDKTRIKKIVYLFLFELENNKQDKLKLSKYEKIKPIWVDLNKANKIASFDNVKETIKEVQKIYV